MERIAPLARILAEANGIDWQQLRGTGDGGMVVEQDILNYLSRIMSGEEEPPSTPVDVPPPDWNGDMNAMPDLSGVSADQMARAGVESDITALLGHAAPAPQPEVPVAAPARLDDDLEFELDDAEPETPAAVLPATPATPTLGGWEWSAAAAVPAAPAPHVDAPVAHTAELPAVEVPAVHLPDFPSAVVSAPAAPAPAPVEAAQGSGLGSLLSRLYQQPAAPAPAPALAAPPAPEAPAFPPPMDPDADDHSGPVLDTGAAVHAGHDDLHGAETAVADEHVPAAAPVEPEGTAEAAAPQPVAAQPEPAQPELAQPEPAQPEPVRAEPVAALVLAQTEPVAAVTPVAPAPAQQPVPAAGNAGWSGTYLRRDADVATLAALHGQIVAALEHDLPLALLVARAAQRHVAGLGLTSVALHAEEGAHSVAGDTLRAAAESVRYGYDGTPDLLVVDAGALDLDDLHFPHTTTLSLGRVHDGRAALSLNGDVDAERGAAFLKAVAQTLGQPVSLLL